MEILKIEDLTFRYPECDGNAIENVSLSVNEGEFAVICGTTGSGKSTLM
ncbi:MAG: ATP-binding cassette domain-containing protein, partial [Clostridia bacterium]|nr:ATP-binding cassette domain-containing protein [Clostridia bacterium]